MSHSSRRQHMIGMLSMAAASLVPTAARAQPRSYRFSPVNQYGVQLTAAYWNPIILWVSQRTGIPIELKVGRTSADTTTFVLTGEVDFAFTNHLFSPEREKLGWQLLARRDAPQVRGQVVVMDDAKVRTLRDLHQQDVGFPGPEAFIAYKVTLAQMLKESVQPKVVFCGNMDSALTQLASGRVRAVGGNSQLVEGFARRTGAKLRPLWSSPGYPDLALLSSPKVPSPDALAVQSAFLAMKQDPDGQEVLQQVSALVEMPSVAGFVKARPDDYDVYRRFFREAPESLR